MFFEKFNIRWNDLDANRHMGNVAYMSYCSQTRMSFLNKHNVGLKQMIRWNIGPVVLKETFQYYREFVADQSVSVSLEVKAISEDGSLCKIVHKFYDSSGIHHASSEVFIMWIDMIQRKKVTPPEELQLALQTSLAHEMETITFEDFKQNSIKPENIAGDLLQ